MAVMPADALRPHGYAAVTACQARRAGSGVPDNRDRVVKHAVASDLWTSGLGEAEFRELYRRLRRHADWGDADRRGALNHITPAKILAAVGEVRLGRSVSLAAPVETVATVDNPEPS